MYAIIADSGRQYKVEEGQEVTIDFRDLAAGEEITFDRVLAVSGENGMQLGQPSCGLWGRPPPCARGLAIA